MKNICACAIALTLLSTGLCGQQQKPNHQACAFNDFQRWFSDSLLEAKSVHIGMTRSDLLKVFVPAGGFGTGEIYQYRGLPYIMVDVKFAPKSEQLESPTDIITAISRPYLEFPAYD